MWWVGDGGLVLLVDRLASTGCDGGRSLALEVVEDMVERLTSLSVLDSSLLRVDGEELV